jgi:hypothetical protein
MLKKIAGLGVVTILMGFPLASPAWAQAGRAEMAGTVFDQAKAVLPGATVTASNEATGVTRETVTAPDGRFVIPTMEPGIYTVRIDLAGFQAQTRSGLVLQVGQELTIDFTLQLASVAETVTVTGAAPIVEVTTSRLGTNLTTQDIDGLPTSGRSQLMLMTLVPGLTPAFQPARSKEGRSMRMGAIRPATCSWSTAAATTTSGAAGREGSRRACRSTRWPSSRC